MKGEGAPERKRTAASHSQHAHARAEVKSIEANVERRGLLADRLGGVE